VDDISFQLKKDPFRPPGLMVLMKPPYPYDHGYFFPDEGRITFNGKFNADDDSALIGYMPEEEVCIKK
jgi:hypothetical protein